MQPVDPGTYVYDAAPVVIIGPSRWPKVDSTSQTLTADGVKGATSVAVASAAAHRLNALRVIGALLSAHLRMVVRTSDEARVGE